MQRRVLSNLVLRFLNSSAGTALWQPDVSPFIPFCFCRAAANRVNEMLVQQRQSVPKERCNVPVFPSSKLIGIDQLQNLDLNGHRNVMVKLATASEIKLRLQISSNSRFRAQAGTAKTTYQQE